MAVFRPFSLRNKQKIDAGTLEVQPSTALRNRVWATLSDRNQSFGIQRDPGDNWVDNTDIVSESGRLLCKVYGLIEPPGVAVAQKIPYATRLYQFAINDIGHRLLDTIEAFLSFYDKKDELAEEVNSVFSDESCPWKLANGEFIEVIPDIGGDVRRECFDLMQVGNISWNGKLEETEFLIRLYDLDKLKSTDPRYKTASDDIIKHRVHNDDWPPEWVYTDERFELLDGPTTTFIAFLQLMLDPIVRDAKESAQLVLKLNAVLSRSSYQILQDRSKLGLPAFTCRQISAAGSKSIAHGGFGDVRIITMWKRIVATKTLQLQHRYDESAVARFKNEIECLKKLRDVPGVVSLVSDDVYGDGFTYAMEKADQDLFKYIESAEDLGEDARIIIMGKILKIMAAVHKSNVVHRDICPRNILMFGEQPKVSDFGLALDRDNAKGMTRSSVVLGKDLYMAPEMLSGLNKATNSSDVFALGMLCVFVITGREERDLDGHYLGSLVQRATNSSFSKRYADAGAMLEDLRSRFQAKRNSHDIANLVTMKEDLRSGKQFNPEAFHQLIITFNPTGRDIFDEFWDPLTSIMQNDRPGQYAEWAGPRISEYVQLCTKMYDDLPRNGWNFDAVTSMARAVLDPVRIHNHSDAVLLILDFLWNIGFHQDRWRVIDMILTYLKYLRNTMTAQIEGHVVSLISGAPIHSPGHLAKIGYLPASIQAAFRAKLDSLEPE